MTAIGHKQSFSQYKNGNQRMNEGRRPWIVSYTKKHEANISTTHAKPIIDLTWHGHSTNAILQFCYERVRLGRRTV